VVDFLDKWEEYNRSLNKKCLRAKKVLTESKVVLEVITGARCEEEKITGKAENSQWSKDGGNKETSIWDGEGTENSSTTGGGGKTCPSSEASIEVVYECGIPIGRKEGKQGQGGGEKTNEGGFVGARKGWGILMRLEK